MKKPTALFLSLTILLILTSCERKIDETSTAPNLDELSACTQEQLEEKLFGLSEKEMHNFWGEPDGMLSGFWGDLWYLDGERNQQIILYYNQDGIVEDIICSSLEEEIVSGEVFWEYMPMMSSRYPAMPFSFDGSFCKITAACGNGVLIDYDHFDYDNKTYPQGKTISIQNGGNLYWAPWFEGEDAGSAEVTFNITDEDDTVIHEGSLLIIRTEETKLGTIYSASLKEGSGLTLTQNPSQLGGVISELSN